MPHQIQKIIQTHQEHTRAQTQKKSYKPINETQKNHKRILYKKKKINPHIYTNQIIQKKIDLNPKIKSIQSLTKYPQPNKNIKNTASTIPTRTSKQTHSNNKPPFNPPPNPPLLLHNH